MSRHTEPTITAPQRPAVGKGETRAPRISFEGRLSAGELLTGTPSVVEIGTADLTVSNVAVNTAALTIDGQAVAVGQAVQCLVTGFDGKTLYKLRVTCGTDSTPAQQLQGIIEIPSVPDGS